LCLSKWILAERCPCTENDGVDPRDIGSVRVSARKQGRMESECVEFECDVCNVVREYAKFDVFLDAIKISHNWAKATNWYERSWVSQIGLPSDLQLLVETRISFKRYRDVLDFFWLDRSFCLRVELAYAKTGRNVMDASSRDSRGRQEGRRNGGQPRVASASSTRLCSGFSCNQWSCRRKGTNLAGTPRANR